MYMIKFNDLFYTCSLIEFIGRQQRQERSFVVRQIGKDTLTRIYKYADVFHCELIGKVYPVHKDENADLLLIGGVYFEKNKLIFYG